MPRLRRAVDSEDDSSKENQDVSSTVSNRNKNSSKKSSAKMSSAPSRKNRTGSHVLHVDDDENEDLNTSNEQDNTVDEQENNEEGDEDDEDEEGSPNGKKRSRINQEGDSVTVKDEKPIIHKRVTLPRDTDGYVPGSIVRMQLKNFVTYDFVEFRPGPNLNMIFGPNGTGKSSIACGICLCLNGAPSLLGRATDLNSFVKIGHDTAHVEIELKGKFGTPNLVIRRNLNAKNRASTFTLNGHAINGNQVSARLAELNVQVSNLCSFLPQDRVAEFAKLTPQQLLRETQRTAGDENLTRWHDDLIERGKEIKTTRSSIQDDEKHANALEERQKALERDVKRFNERRAIERQIEVLEVVLPYVEYRESKAVYDEAKAARDRAGVEYRQLEEANRPMKEFQAELKQQSQNLEKEREALKNQAKRRYDKTVTATMEKNKKSARRAEDALGKLQHIKRTEKENARNIAKTKETIDTLQEKIDNPPSFEPPEPLHARIKEIKTNVGNLKLKKMDLENAIKDLVHRMTENNRTIDDKKAELNMQHDIMKRKIEALARWDSQTAEVANYIVRQRNLGDEFAKRVELPAILNVTVRDPGRYAAAIEACMNASQQRTFITRSAEDYRYFNRIFHDTPEALGRKVRVTVWYRPPGPLMNPPLAPEELRGLGFDGYAIDFVECTEAMKWYLTKELNMHRTPISLRGVDDDRVQAALSRLDRNGRSPPNASYIAGQKLFMVSRSAYGQRKTMTVARTVRPPRNLIHPSIDPDVKRRIDEAIAQLEQANQEFKANVEVVQAEERELIEQISAFKPEMNDLNARIQKVNQIQVTITNDKNKLDSLQRKLEFYLNKPSSEEERQSCNEIVQQTIKERSTLLAMYVAAIKKAIEDQAALASISLRQIQLEASVEALDELCNARSAEVKRVKQAWDQATDTFKAAKADSSAKVAVIRDKLGSLDDELQQTFKQLEQEDKEKSAEEQWNSDKVRASLDTERQKLELNHATDAGVIATFEARQREIECLHATLQKKREKLEKLQIKMTKTRDLWFPALSGLTKDVGQKFSAAFDRINCAGEIRLAEHEDYDRWAIEIYVKFRDEEPLMLLTPQRQSGGERAVSTMLYLLSLTENARTPFSLVDEINQGMDCINERKVHDQLVEVTCKPYVGQYFLITPKLLPGLRYHKSMKILCVNNGEWLPDTTASGVGNMRKMIDNFVAMRRAKPSAS